MEEDTKEAHQEEETPETQTSEVETETAPATPEAGEEKPEGFWGKYGGIIFVVGFAIYLVVLIIALINEYR
jgi:hypothetical protein